MKDRPWTDTSAVLASSNGIATSVTALSLAQPNREHAAKDRAR
ncbi:hypothetical protein ACFL6C_03670 [Myxococcota bacterium]